MIVVVGEALVDVVVSSEGATTRAPGGSPMNVAVGLARLGLDTGLLTRLGPDEDGDLVREHLEDSGVRLLGEHRAERTAVAAARLAASGDAAYEFAITWDLPATELTQDAEALHFGSLGAVVEPGADAVVELARVARARGLPVSYDPNVRPAITPDPHHAWSTVRDQAALADLVRLSDEDAAFLQPDRTVREVAASLLDRGPSVVVVTSGDRGTVAITREHEVDVPVSARGPVADTVGAGDSFMAALVAVTLPQRRTDPSRWRPSSTDLERQVRAAHTAAAVTVSRPGADPPWQRELPDDWGEGPGPASRPFGTRQDLET